MTADGSNDRGLVDLAMKFIRSGKSGQNSDLVGSSAAEELRGEAQGPAEPYPEAINPEGGTSIDQDVAASTDNPKPQTTLIADAVAQKAQTIISKAPVITAVDGRQCRAPQELADIIFKTLLAIDGLPSRGFVVTVYGNNPWNAMLTITHEAGPIKDAQLWRTRVQEIAVRLRKDFDVSYVDQ